MTAIAQDNARSAEATFDVAGMDFASCVGHVQKAIRSVGGVQESQVNLARGRAVVRFDPEKTDTGAIANAITNVGYPAKPQAGFGSEIASEQERLNRQRDEARAWFRRAAVGIVLWFPVEATHWIRHLAHVHMHVDWMVWLSLITSSIGLVYVGSAFYRSAFRAALRRTTNMDTLIAMGATVAYLYSVGALFGHLWRGWPLADLYFMESTGLLALISLGHWLEARARESAGSAIRELLNLAPATALRVREGAESNGGVGASPTQSRLEPPDRGRGAHATESEEIPVADLQVNDVILIRPGDRVPIDGVVIDGRSSVNESMITGEPLPVTRGVGDAVIGGTQNVDGALKVRVTKTGSQTALAQIVQLVERTQSSRPAVQKLADQIAAVFVPSVLAIALITAIGWYLFGTLHHWESAHTWGMLAKAVCSVLIIACPCALGLAVPATLMVGTGMGAKRGILIRDIDALQTAERIDTIVLDKTGTITQGKPIVTEIQPLGGLALDEVLRLAASAEQYSEHPLAKAIVAHAKSRGLSLSEPSSFTNEPGLGVVAQVDGQTVFVGNHELMDKYAPSTTDSAHDFKSFVTPEIVEKVKNEPDVARLSDAAAYGTSSHVAIKRPDGHVQRLGFVTLSDELKQDSQQAIEQLHAMTLHTILLSGDHLLAAKAIGDQVGITDIRANVKPDGKAAVIRELQNRQSAIGNRKSPRNSAVAMVGDGINDAPALAQADLGIAIGSGSDIAKETGDIVLVGGSLHGIATAIRLSKATMTKIRQNLFLAFIYNVLAIPLAALGLLNPLIAAAAMALSDVTVIGNALLLRRVRIDAKPQPNAP